MTIIGDKVILRDFLPEDIPKRIEWETVETEWQSWDAPWEYDDLTAEEKQADLKRYEENMRRWAQQPPPENERRMGFQICLNTKEREYIGWCSAYRIDEAFHFARDGRHCAVGIDLPERWARGKGVCPRSAFAFYPVSAGCWRGRNLHADLVRQYADDPAGGAAGISRVPPGNGRAKGKG